MSHARSPLFKLHAMGQSAPSPPSHRKGSEACAPEPFSLLLRILGRRFCGRLLGINLGLWFGALLAAVRYRNHGRA